MADYRSGGQNSSVNRMIYAVLSEMEFSKPGKIVKFDPDTNLCDAQPVVKRKVTIEDKAEYRELPVILRVPVVLPYSPMAGLCFTQPIRKGDPCLLLFSDRMLDNFIDQFAKGGCCVAPECCGGDNKTSEPRIHHLTDGMCIPGLHGIKDKIPKWNNEAIEMRNFDRTAFISLAENGDIAIQNTGKIVIKGDAVEIHGNTIDLDY